MRRAVAAIVLGVAVLSTAACGSNNFRDVEGVPSKDPDSISLWSNVDGNPNIVRVCLDGVAFATTNRPDFGSIMRVPEWDERCPVK